MLVEPRLSNRVLAELCHRLAVETEAGIDVRRTWQREAESARGPLRPAATHVREAVARGESVSHALAGTGQVFPPLFLEMVHVGEETGTLAGVFRRLEAHYRRVQQAQRIFLAAIAWPMIELGFAVLVIGVLIWILGFITARNNGQVVDVLGFGLVGTRGLLIYVNFVVAVGLCIWAVVTAIRRGMLWTRPLQDALLRVPAIGLCMERIALARLTWVLSLVLNTALDLRRAVPLALRATGNDHYVCHTDQIVADIADGQPLHVAFARSGAFPPEFLDAIEVAEESGTTVEAMDQLSKRYEDEAQSAVRALAVIVGFLVGVVVMAVIVLLIFRLAGFYFGTINSLLDETK